MAIQRKRRHGVGMKEKAHRTLTLHWDGEQFVAMETRNHVIQRLERITDIDLKVPESWKIELKRTD